MSNEYAVTTAGLAELGGTTSFIRLLQGFAGFTLVGASPAEEVVARWQGPKKLYDRLLKDAERVKRWLKKNMTQPNTSGGFLVTFTPCDGQPEVGLWRCWYSPSLGWIVSTAMIATTIMQSREASRRVKREQPAAVEAPVQEVVQ